MKLNLPSWLNRGSPEDPKTSLSNPAQWLFDLFGGGESATGITVNRETAMRVSAVYACVRAIAEPVSFLPVHVYREKKGGGKEKITDHPVAHFLGVEPNEYMMPSTYREAVTGCAVLQGNGYSLIDRNGAGKAIELRPLSPEQVMVERFNGVLRYRVDGTVIPKSDMLHIPAFGFDGLQGYSPLTVARESIGLAVATERYGSKLFKNGARPGGVLTTANRLGPEGRKRLKTSWENAHGGAGNAHGVAVLEDGMTWQSVGMTAEDSQFLETRKFQINDIARIFRVPPHMIGDLERATFSNIEHQGYEFVRYTLLPWITRWEQEVRRKLLGVDTGLYLKFNPEGLLRGDVKNRYAAYGRGIQDGWLTRNEARAWEDLDPLEGLDEPLQPLNMKKAGDLDEEDDKENDDEQKS
ncbi:phage portal protein [Magnetococcus sp. PR-3]|uniref:phage portal protein n=1 Tax=Magnetococcus sp. PR-3 TaxID=3120355 RepID=UPI002FCE27EE